jgi:chromosome transmission fidelity protein 1
VFDEAHNIMETITSMNSVEVTSTQLSAASKSIADYIDKYGSRLAPKNLKSLKDILHVVNALSKYISSYEMGSDA